MSSEKFSEKLYSVLTKGEWIDSEKDSFLAESLLKKWDELLQESDPPPIPPKPEDPV